MNSQEEVKFTNSAPDDKEWTAHIKLLNEWVTPDRYLRDILIHNRSGKHYPTDMHVDLIMQLIEARERAARLDELEHTGIEKHAIICCCKAHIVSRGYGTTQVKTKEERIDILKEELNQ